MAAIQDIRGVLPMIARASMFANIFKTLTNLRQRHHVTLPKHIKKFVSQIKQQNLNIKLLTCKLFEIFNVRALTHAPLSVHLAPYRDFSHLDVGRSKFHNKLSIILLTNIVRFTLRVSNKIFHDFICSNVKLCGWVRIYPYIK